MPPPDIIQVKFSEDTAQHADIRPVRRQPMTLTELAGLVLCHTGKDRDRLREILRRGTCTYNIYRYWWEALEPSAAELKAALAAFPDPDPARPFDPADCVWVRFSDAAEPKPRRIVVERAEAVKRRRFVRESFWMFLLRFAAARPPVYTDYSYYDKADLYALELSGPDRAALLEGIKRQASRALRRRLARAPEFVRVELACTRT